MRPGPVRTPPDADTDVDTELDQPVAVRVDGIEVTQAVQDLVHSVPLIAGRTTVIRVYLALDGSSDRAVTVGGELELHRDGGPARYLPALDTVRLDPSATPSLVQRRGDTDLSLNFLLADADVVAGELVIAVGRLVDAMAGRRLALAEQPAVPPGLTVSFVETPPLRIRLIGMRYLGAGGQPISPRAIDFELLVSWLRRAYPVARVEHSQIVTDLPLTRPFICGQVNAVLAATRNLDVTTGTDPRTHYLGLVHDNGGAFFMRGGSSGLPAVADPTVVASGPVGIPTDGFAWDGDESYGDWYGAHELAHTFGRRHPGFPAGGQTREDAAFPHADGQISDGDTYVGFDVGDSSRRLPMRALPGQQWHDVMTYSPHQWISGYTYQGILARLIDEETITMPSDSLDPPATTASAAAGAPGPARIDQPRVLNVVATVDLTAGTAEIVLINPLPAALPQTPRDPSAQRVTLRMIGVDGVVEDHEVAVQIDSCADEPGQPRTGLVDAVVDAPAGLAAVELHWDGRSRSRHEIPSATPRQTQLQLAPRPVGSASAGASASGHRRTISWSGHEEGIRYNVQISDDEGATWQTIAVNRADPSVEIDRNQFHSNQLQVRVLATDGVQVRRSQLSIDMGD